ncbi:FAD-dependent monooxygenase [Nonomuraea typhae]|uniref:FAD-dependent monooxygenase n=1 Tax=Nonomuraea typhae TaxID=2603600 RepID=UPI0012F70D20|nr:FAD-dependent monooxygenase [Nonomuraea typhae]
MATIDVLVIGAGPTGLVLAADLRRHGASVRLIDARADRLDLSKAPGVQARTLELLDRRGLARELISRGAPTDSARLHVSKRRTTRFPLEIGARDTRFPYLLMVSQTETEDILEQALDIPVERQTRLISFTQDADGVTALLRRADGTEEEVRARYLVGSDGVRSTVREQLGIAFEGETYPRSFLLGDVHIDGLDHDSLHIYPSRQGFALLIPLQRPAPWRLIAVEPGVPRENAPEPTEADLHDALLGLSGGTLSLRDPVWISRFPVHCRMAARFRDGRVFLAGDAAHVHSPAGAQGMNTGMQDAWNLGWKLALVATGRAPAELLDSYEAERMPVAAYVLKFTDRIFSIQASRHWLISGLRRLLIGPFARLISLARPLRQRAFRRISQLGIEYPDSPAITPGAGQRLADLELPDGNWLHELLQGPGYHLLTPEPSNLGRSFLTVHQVPVPEALLVRPDGYIAHRGQAGLEAYLHRWLQPEGVRRARPQPEAAP